MMPEIPPSYEMARAAFAPMVEDARTLLARHGPAGAVVRLKAHHLDCWPEDDREALAGALGMALVELARREASDA